jgi:hypothetical protein
MVKVSATYIMQSSPEISCGNLYFFSHHDCGNLSGAKNQIIVWSEGFSFGLDSVFRPPPYPASSSELSSPRPIIPSGLRKILTIQLLTSSELDYEREDSEESQDSEENGSILFFDPEEGDY